MNRKDSNLDLFIMSVCDYAKRFKYMDDQELVRNAISRYLFNGDYSSITYLKKQKVDSIILEYKIPIAKSKKGLFHNFMVKRACKIIGLMRKIKNEDV